MSVLVTGGAGYIGSHTCVELLDAGYDIVVLDNFSNSKPEALDSIRQLTGKDFPFYQADVLDEAALGKLFAEQKIDAVIHFAALKAVGESVSMPLEYYHTNITGTLNLLSAMRAAGCKRFVFSSSATVYGTSQDVPFREEMPTSATNPYGWTKVMNEQILRDLYTSDNSWRIALLRYFNPIGAHPSGLLGEDPNGIPNNLVPYVAKVAAGELPEVQITGNDYDTPDGTGVRDYLHVVDLAIGHVKALDYITGHEGLETVNLGTGKGYSVLDVIHAYERACGRELPKRLSPRRPGDIAVCYADPSKAKRLYGWEAKRDLDEMCADSWRFVQKHRS
ncbi:MAG: UDP-glucose 4-epimerase GalE [Oscillospiraceae bacterium]